MFLKFRSICTEEMDHTFSQLISVILPVLSDGPRWRQVASHGVRNYYEKDQLQQDGTSFFLHTQKTLLSKGSLKMQSFYQTVSQLNCFCNDP